MLPKIFFLTAYCIRYITKLGKLLQRYGYFNLYSTYTVGSKFDDNLETKK